jgi:hypothetical protein
MTGSTFSKSGGTVSGSAKPFRCAHRSSAGFCAGMLLIALLNNSPAPSAPLPSLSFRQSAGPAIQPPRTLSVQDETQAIGRLSALGVPVEKDAAGKAYSIEALKGEMSDEALRLLPALPGLEWLEISGGKVTAGGLASLKGCRALKRLYVHDLEMGDDVLAFLSDLTRLESLSLQRTRVTGRFLRFLSSSGPLSVLNLTGNKIEEKELSTAAKLKNLEVFALERTGVTGTGLALLKGMPKLNVLNISHCSVTNADLELFVTMPNLRIVHAHGCGFDRKAADDVTERLPMLAIFTQ